MPGHGDAKNYTGAHKKMVQWTRSDNKELLFHLYKKKTFYNTNCCTHNPKIWSPLTQIITGINNSALYKMFRHE